MKQSYRYASRAAVGLLVTAVASRLIASGLQPESQLFGPTLVAGNDPAEWALTYDDGPNPRSTPELLDALARHNARATFFMVGKFVREEAELVRRVHAAGHLVGNHTMSHPFLANKSLRFVSREVRDCNALLEDTIGAPVGYFRAPFGARRPAILRFLRDEGIVPVQWNAQGNDWEANGVEAILARIAPGLARARARGRGANILLHDGFDKQQGFDRTSTVQATEALLRNAGRKGIRLVTVDAWG